MNILGWLFWLLVLGTAAYVMIVKNPAHPRREGIAWNWWSYVGVIAALLTFGYVYNQLAGVPEILKSRQTTHFRQRGPYTWMLTVPANMLELNDAEKQGLIQELGDPKVKTFDVETIEYALVGEWLPVQLFPPKFYTLQVTFSGQAGMDDETKEVRKASMTSVCDKVDLEAWLADLEGHPLPMSGVLGSRSGFQVPINEIPGRLKK